MRDTRVRVNLTPARPTRLVTGAASSSEWLPDSDAAPTAAQLADMTGGTIHVDFGVLQSRAARRRAADVGSTLKRRRPRVGVAHVLDVVLAS